MMSKESPYASLREVAERWGVPISWLYERSRRDALPGQRRLGRHVRIDLEIFERGVRDGLLSPKSIAPPAMGCE
jgi:predicted DNA-binding transcriptional regulator AlpA